jgi:hypothetical protein
MDSHFSFLQSCQLWGEELEILSGERMSESVGQVEAKCLHSDLLRRSWNLGRFIGLGSSSAQSIFEVVVNGIIGFPFSLR